MIILTDSNYWKFRSVHGLQIDNMLQCSPRKNGPYVFIKGRLRLIPDKNFDRMQPIRTVRFRGYK